MVMPATIKSALISLNTKCQTKDGDGNVTSIAEDDWADGLSKIIADAVLSVTVTVNVTTTVPILPVITPVGPGATAAPMPLSGIVSTSIS